MLLPFRSPSMKKKEIGGERDILSSSRYYYPVSASEIQLNGEQTRVRIVESTNKGRRMERVGKFTSVGSFRETLNRIQAAIIIVCLLAY